MIEDGTGSDALGGIANGREHQTLTCTVPDYA